MSENAPRLVESHHPASFHSRGVAVPFTTPMLTGTRVREAETGIELVVPNPSGGRGVYILDWGGVRALGNPTVHDTVLFRRMAGIARLDPAGIREAALHVARDGHAGRDAAARAEQCIAGDAARRIDTHFRLMISLIGQVHPNGSNPACQPWNAEDVERRGSAILDRLAPLTGRSAANLADALAAIGDVLAPVGVAAADKGARTAGLLARMQEAHDSLSGWLGADADNDVGDIGRDVAAAMRTAIGYGQAVLHSTRAATAEPIGLLKRWIKDPDDVVAMASRADWVLDGWEWICLLWLAAASEVERRRALLEMASLVPVLPAEAGCWTDLPPPPEMQRQPCRVTSRDNAWRSGGAAFALIERNEILRAMSI